ncbi:putative endonuclease [Marmoricola sp. OAE513]|uniref:GIY-YIG nuclease family protein n=1 Tax=Marmoricola sp. OAE513 TaxID=2817894 RepID=UPI001AE22045
MAWTYILQCLDGSYYVGSTTLLEARVYQHQRGMGAEYTRRRLPVVLVWAEEFETIPEAFAFEKKVQNWSRAKREALIEGRYDDLPGLARGRNGWMKRGVQEDPGG